MSTLLLFYNQFYSFVILIVDFFNSPLRELLKTVALGDVPILGDLLGVIIDTIFAIMGIFGIPSDVTVFSGLFGGLGLFLILYQLFKFLIPA